MEPPAARAPDRRCPLTRRAFAAAFAIGAFAIGAFAIGACAEDESGTAPDVRPEATAPTTEPSLPEPATSPRRAAPSPPTPSPPTPSSSTTGGGVLPEDFTTTVVRITAPDGEVCEVCVWLADSPDEQVRGLMGVTGLGDAAGMLFEFGRELETTFFMYQTPEPLSIAWFAGDGRLVGTDDMAPCLDVPAADCPRYSPGEPFAMALEVWSGGLDALGLADGSTLEVIGPESSDCTVT